MSNKTDELTEQNALLAAELEAAQVLLADSQAALDSLKDKHRRDVNDYKKKIKSAALTNDRIRVEEFEKAKKKAGTVRTKAKKLVKVLRETDQTNLGIPAKAEINAQIAVIEKLFNGV